MKKLIYIFIFILSLNLAFALDDFIKTGSSFNPINSNLSYEVIQNITTNNISVGYNCINISNGTYQGNYCYKLNDLYIDNKILLKNTSDLSCYINFETGNVGTVLNLIYNWYNSSGSIIKSGFTTCDQDTLCKIDTLLSSEINNNDGIYCNVNYVNDWYNVTTSNTQKIYISDIGECSSELIYPILNLSYYDEKTLLPINVSNTYNIDFYDDNNVFNLKGNVDNVNNNKFCTNLNPNNSSLELKITSQYIINSNDYISRVISRIPPNYINVSNENIAQEELYLVGIDNSSTIKFTWRTPEYQYINGQMIIYSCNSNNDISLIDTVDINSGIARANLQLLSESYYYEVITNDKLYKDTSSFSRCHVESSTETSYLININKDNLEPVLGLFLVDCGIEKISNNTVKMSWSSNQYDSSDITACILGNRILPTGLTEIYRNCTTAKSGSFIRTIENNGNAYYVTGEISQHGNTKYCNNQINFFEASNTSKSLGIDGLLAIVLLIIAITLMFSTSGIKMLFGVGISIIIVFNLGILSLPIQAIIGIIIFLGIIGFIGSYVRKK